MPGEVDSFYERRHPCSSLEGAVTLSSGEIRAAFSGLWRAPGDSRFWPAQVGVVRGFARSDIGKSVNKVFTVNYKNQHY